MVKIKRSGRLEFTFEPSKLEVSYKPTKIITQTGGAKATRMQGEGVRDKLEKIEPGVLRVSI